MMKMRWLFATLLGLALVGAGVGVGIASNAFDEGTTTQFADEREGAHEDGEGVADEQLEGSEAERAAAAAISYTDERYGAGGQVTEVEAGDDGAAFGVEVLLPDGRQVEVHLDADFTATGDEVDDD